ncbi:MAG: hypothetical protein IT518_06470, partial [Burkholderiales bacterium]|nr:hypothetical protein [Burkholderiales bacterium]
MWVAVYFGIAVAIGFAAYAGWAAYAVMHGAAPWKFVVGLPLAYLAVPLLFTAVWVFFGWYWRGPRPAEVEMSLLARLRFFWHEYVAIAQAPKMIAFRWLMPD